MAVEGFGSLELAGKENVLLDDLYSESVESEPTHMGGGAAILTVEVVDIAASGAYEADDNSYVIYVLANSVAAPDTWHQVSDCVYLGDSDATGLDNSTVAGEIHNLLVLNKYDNDIKVVLNMSGTSAFVELVADLKSAYWLP